MSNYLEIMAQRNAALEANNILALTEHPAVWVPGVKIRDPELERRHQEHMYHMGGEREHKARQTDLRLQEAYERTIKQQEDREREKQRTLNKQAKQAEEAHTRFIKQQEEQERQMMFELAERERILDERLAASLERLTQRERRNLGFKNNY